MNTDVPGFYIHESEGLIGTFLKYGSFEKFDINFFNKKYNHTFTYELPG